MPPFFDMGSTPSIVVVHSSNIQEDREALMAIFPDRFQVEKSPSVAAEYLHLEDQLTLVLISCGHAKGTYSAVVMEEGDVRRACERATLYGVTTTENVVSGFVVAKLSLPGGSTLLISTSESWKSEESRNATIMSVLEPSNNIVLPNEQREDFSLPRRTSKRRNSSVLQRSSTMPEMTDPSTASMNNSRCRLFPTLDVRVLSREQKFESFTLNSQSAVPIETECFVGKLVLVMRPTNPEDDPYWNERIFSKKKRRVIMQLQGKLKYKPKGELYAGMEISDPMRLGLLANGMCNILLKMSQKFNPQIHYSFGDDKERPHICFPASTFFEQLLITPPGETPPPLGVEFEESPQSVQLRKAYKSKIDWNTEDTYSFAFHSMYLDFPTWSVVRLPMGRDLSLQTFWGNSSASVVLYEVNDSYKQHLTSTNTYLAAVQMVYVGKGSDEGYAEVDRSSDTEGSEERFVEVDIDNGSISTCGDGSFQALMHEDPDDEELEFFDTFQSQSLLPEVLESVAIEVSPASSHATVMRAIDNCCPCVIDMIGKRGKYTHVYAFTGRKKPLFRTFEHTQELLGDRHLAEVNEAVFPHRLSQLETSRRKIGLRYAEALLGKSSPAKMNQFQTFQSFFDKQFLRRDSFLSKGNVKSRMVARATSDRHWVEECGVISESAIEFYGLDKAKPHFRISLSSVVKATPLPEDDRPLLPGYHFLSIQTFGRSTCLMVPSEDDLKSWLDAIGHHRPSQGSFAQAMNSFTNHLIDVDEPTAEFLQRSSMWECHKRQLLNCRKFSFRFPHETSPQTTLALAEAALRKVTSLEPKGSNDSDLIAFLDCAAALKEADPHSLNETERFAFFLNIYHIMIMHSYLVLGPPDSSLKWPSYFNNVSYQCGDDIFSLAELEHNIIRAEMSYPSQFLSRFVVPKSQYRFALTKPDLRINFALNCGSLSIPTNSVPIYTPTKLEEQLDNVTRAFLGGTVSVKPKGARDATITLPRVCQWFADDFGDGSTSDILKAVEPFLDADQQKCLSRLWNERKQSYDLGIFSVKYHAYIFECRFLVLESDTKS